MAPSPDCASLHFFDGPQMGSYRVQRLRPGVGRDCDQNAARRWGFALNIKRLVKLALLRPGDFARGADGTSSWPFALPRARVVRRPATRSLPALG